MSIVILTDSACDITLEYREKYNIHILPWWIRIGIELHEDFPRAELLKWLQQGERFEALPPDDLTFKKTYRKLLEEYSQILYIRTSAQYDPTYPKALAAAEKFPGLVTIFDS